MVKNIQPFPVFLISNSVFSLTWPFEDNFKSAAIHWIMIDNEQRTTYLCGGEHIYIVQ